MKQFLTVLLFAILSPVAAAQGAFLGVELNSQSALGSAEIQSVQERSAGSLMGLQPGDVVVSLDSVAVNSATDLVAAVSARLPGEIVDVKIIRNQEELTLTGVLGRRPGVDPVFTIPPLLLDGSQLPDYGIPDNFIPFSRIIPPVQETPWVIPFEEGFGDVVFPWPQIDSIPLNQDWLIPWAEQAIQIPSIELQPAQVQQSVLLIYPESTGEEQRKVLLKEAQAQYGDDVEVRFEGNATQIRIQTSSRIDSDAGDSTQDESAEMLELEGELREVKVAPVPVPKDSGREY